MGTDLSIKPSGSSEKSASSLKILAPILGCGSLIISIGCVIAIPISYIFTMAMGMGAGETSYTEGMYYGSLILLVLSPIVAVVAGLVGIVLLILWGIEMLKTLSTNSR